MDRARRTLTFLAVLALLAAALPLAACGLLGAAGPKYTAEDLMQVWNAHPESAKWDLEVRDVIGQRKSTGSHDADYTVFLTTYTNKSVPGFRLYETVDIPSDDSMTFEERAGAFFDSIGYGSQFSGVQDIEAFMAWYAEQYPDAYFVRLKQTTGADGKSTWEPIAYDSAPIASTMTDEGSTGITLVLDEETKAWSEQ